MLSNDRLGSADAYPGVPGERISNLVKDKTVLIIAHRMRTVAGADRIVVLKDGLVAEQGTPRELMDRNGVYRHMAELQGRSLTWSL